MENQYNSDDIKQLFETLDLNDFSESEQSDLIETELIAHILFRNKYIEYVKQYVDDIARLTCLLLYKDEYNPDNIDNNDKERLYLELRRVIHFTGRRRLVIGNTLETLRHTLFELCHLKDSDYIFELVKGNFKAFDINPEQEKTKIYNVIKKFQKHLSNDLIYIMCYYKHPIYQSKYQEVYNHIFNITFK